MSPCEQALTLVNDPDWAGDGSPMMVRFVAGQSIPLTWIDVATYCPGRFGEGVLRDAQTKAQLSSLAERLGGVAPTVTPARLDGVTSAVAGTDVLDAMAVAEDRAGFALEVLAARGQTDGATLALSDMHKTAGQQLVSLADGSWGAGSGNSGDSGDSDSGSGSSSGSGTSSDDGDSGSTAASGSSNGTGNAGTHADPRKKVYDISQLLANPTTIADKASGQTVPTAAAIEMDCARTEIKAVTDADAPFDDTTLSILAALAAKHAYTAIQLGYPATDAALFE
ncbi:hypothetical protein [Bifidobacterium sp. UTBIF-78]|uniref:hypothetical protein n=1 Tax=Bifidobacterium sp. UTBIF-78 TaxID=1465263 RepID=UPI0015E2CB03|nr:hypothetical protein [Bifidobacterium sp. UTBIF-78]TPF94299.1 hypothetical protein BG22_05835 [Bifidobacterium sp. UTBIF-78]